ncbi:MAG: aminopeptidase P family protein [Proteobacteria bacterium]|nr:aminopeptidase P family protein [Pseudomonadota bacterium]
MTLAEQRPTFPVPPAPSTPRAELESRLARIQAQMERERVGFLVLTGRSNIEYFSDYRSLTWAYHARPQLGFVSQDGLTLVLSRIETRNYGAVPRFGEAMYYDGYFAEGVAMLIGAVAARDPAGRETAAIDYGQDMLGRGSVALVAGLQQRAAQARVIDGADLLWRVRMIKTPYEADLKRIAFRIVNAAFDEGIAEARLGMSEAELCRIIQSKIVLKGAERFDPIAMLFSHDEFIYSRPPGADRRLEERDYIWTDFRATYGGYPADRNRVARAGRPADWEVEAWSTVRSLTLAICNGVRPGRTCGDVYRDFQRLWTEAKLGSVYGLASRIGHGGGLDVTEPPSIAPNDAVIEEGMILHIEPKLEKDGAVFQFEEVIYVRRDGVDFLSEWSPERCPLVLR